MRVAVAPNRTFAVSSWCACGSGACRSMCATRSQEYTYCVITNGLYAPTIYDRVRLVRYIMLVITMRPDRATHFGTENEVAKKTSRSVIAMIVSPEERCARDSHVTNNDGDGGQRLNRHVHRVHVRTTYTCQNNSYEILLYLLCAQMVYSSWRARRENEEKKSEFYFIYFFQ